MKIKINRGNFEKILTGESSIYLERAILMLKKYGIGNKINVWAIIQVAHERGIVEEILVRLETDEGAHDKILEKIYEKLNIGSFMD